MTVKMKKADQITAIVLLLFSAFVIEESSKMTLFVEFAPGYGFFPFWLGVLMALLSIMLLVDARRRPAEKDELAPIPGREALIKVVLVLAGLGVYAFLMEITGYVVDTLLLVVLLLGVVEREKWQTTAFVAVLMTALLYLIFQVILGVSLPKGPLGF
jgi:putative tricarboxylic transport membrane protein